MIDYEVLRFIWWLLVGILLIGFAVTDGFDMGEGMLTRFLGRNDTERRIMINSIAPHWDGNQVWLITAGGALFAAWPMVYAAAFSGFYVAMILVLVLGPGVESIVIVTVLINIPLYARVIRGQTLSKKSLEYIDAARCSGASEMSILFRHLLPNTVNPIVIHGSLNLAAAVGNVAVLSFLGIGIRPPTPDLGVMVAEGTNYLVQGAWWMSICPGLVLATTIFSLNLMGDALEARLDPRRGSE